MVFDPKNNSLREIHNMMTKINDLHQEADHINEDEKDLLVQHMTSVFGLFGDTPNKGLIAIELLLGALNADINAYREKVRKSRLEFQKFQGMRKANLRF
jgi:hypothetical protein